MPTAADWLNYHHLLYFWTVAREGSIAKAAKRLHLTHPTISGQVRELETSFGERLVNRVGRHLQLTEVGQVVFQYADEIFALGRELVDTVTSRPTGRPIRLRVGIDDVVPKLVVRRLLAPVFKMPESVRVICHEARADALLAQLSQHTLDVVISDAPVPAGSRVKAFSHAIGECGVSWFATAALARSLDHRFPRSLDGAPVLLPTENTALRRALEPWFVEHRIRPRIVAEFEDSALIKAFGQDGLGVFPAPSAVEDEVREHYKLKVIGRSDELVERFFGISVERRIKNPAVATIFAAARADVFA